MKYKDTQGFSLVELMIAVSALSIFLLGAISAFFGIGRGILISKMKTIATTLAQEKIESLKDISYLRLLVTTQDDLTNPDYGYDNTYYPPETIVVSDINFTRRVLIHKVKEGTNGNLEEVSPTATDTGLKKIKVTVIWTERGNEKSLSLSNLRENSSREATDSTFTGTVYKYPGGSGYELADTKVYVEENLNWETESGTDGSYTLRVSSGTWHLKTSKAGYWEQTSAAITIGKDETKTENFTLIAKSTGSAYGYVYIGSTNTPAVGAVVTCNDGLASVAVSTSTDGYWFLTGIATGTWTIVLSSVTESGAYYLEVASVSTSVNLSTGVPNYSTNPSSGLPRAVLVSTTTDGFISGKVTTEGTKIGGIWVNAGISYWEITDDSGKYWFQLSEGSYQITVNPTTIEYYNSNYTSSTTATVEVNPGRITTIPEIMLYKAGLVSGRVTSNGTDPLSNIIIATYRGYFQEAAAVSNERGEYSFSQLPTGEYEIQPELDTGESSSPESVSIEVEQGSTVVVSTFTISSAYGKITGTVKENNILIKTGVLILATTATLSSEPPVMNRSLRQSVNYYTAISGSDGSYELPVRGNATQYKVYAWYTKLNGATTNTTTPNENESTITVDAGETEELNFSWP